MLLRGAVGNQPREVVILRHPGRQSGRSVAASRCPGAARRPRWRAGSRSRRATSALSPCSRSSTALSSTCGSTSPRRTTSSASLRLKALITHAWVPLDKRSCPWPRPLAQCRGAAVGRTAGLGNRRSALPPWPSLDRLGLAAGQGAEGIIAKGRVHPASAHWPARRQAAALFRACLTLFSNCSLVNGLLT
jgi:hypothetical protein